LTLEQRPRPQGARRLLDDFGEQLLPPDRAAVVTRGDAFEERSRQMGLIVEGRAAGDNCVLARGQSFDDLGWPRCCRDDRLRLVSESQAQHRLVEGVRLAPGGEFVAPQFHVLLAPEPVGLFG